MKHWVRKTVNAQMKPLRFAIFGTGSWARFQLAGWRELEGIECVALYNRTRAKADMLACEFGIPAVYDDPVRLMDREQIDFMDVITDIGTHSRFVALAAERGVPVICQEPMAPSLSAAELMVESCRVAGVGFYVHENWRWQRPIRELKRILESGELGAVARAHLSLLSDFPAQHTQAYTREPEHILLTELTGHLLDTARFLFGEAESIACEAARSDYATIETDMGGAKVTCEVGSGSQNYYPQTLVSVEGANGSLELGPGYRIQARANAWEIDELYLPQHFPWAESEHDVIHASIVSCNEDLARGFRGDGIPETTGEDNLKTVRLVSAAHEAAMSKHVVALS